MDPQTEVLLAKSADDELTMMLDGIPESAFGFHAQQAAEKLIKALLNERGIKYPRTHELQILTAELGKIGEICHLRRIRSSILAITPVLSVMKMAHLQRHFHVETL